MLETTTKIVLPSGCIQSICDSMDIPHFAMHPELQFGGGSDRGGLFDGAETTDVGDLGLHHRLLDKEIRRRNKLLIKAKQWTWKQASSNNRMSLNVHPK